MTLEIANKLTELRKNAGLSQEDVATQLGVSRQAVSKWENGEASPDTENLVGLAKLYNTSVDDILCVETQKKDEKKKRRIKVDLPFIHVDVDDFADEDDERIKVDMPFIHVDTDDADATIEVDGEPDENGVYTKFKKVDVKKKSKWHNFPFPVLVAAIYLFVGFQWNLWHPGWIMFLSIPIYYWLVSGFSKRRFSTFPVAIVVAIAYLCLGFFLKLWHPAWILFVLIPVFDFIFNTKRKD